MDPIHPILPVPPNIPPVSEAPRVGKLDREQRRDRGDESEEPGSGSPTPRRRAAADDEPAMDSDGRLHIDVTA
jgi:hypothetical protein